jgi:hypothetical protein
MATLESKCGVDLLLTLFSMPFGSMGACGLGQGKA